MKNLFCIVLGLSVLGALPQAQATALQSRLVPMNETVMDDMIVLKNDNFMEEGGQAYLQSGFVKGEKAGALIPVPKTIEYFKVISFRVLVGSADAAMIQPLQNVTVFFHMGILPAGYMQPSVPMTIENAANITAGPYWNDIPAEGADSKLPCARGGEIIGGALEFTHDGLPSVYRDATGMHNPRGNVIYAVPGGWNFSQAFGVRGDWLLRVVGRKATAAECGM